MIDNYKNFKKWLDKLEYKPRLLLHSCCAPCSSHTILLLKKYFDITIYYSNDNIHPKSEYDKRLLEQINFVKNIDENIKVIYDEYNAEDYFNAVKGLEDLGEHSKRCYECYFLRMKKTAIKAKENNYEYFSTTLSISPYKNSKWINEIGYSLEEEYNVLYLFSDFKKEEGYKNSIKLSNEYGLYRQDYCGCIYSYNERSQRLNGKSEED